MACIIGAYAYLTLNNAPHPLVLHGTNLAGAILLTVSLVYHMNWPSLVLEAFWAAIAMYGIGKALKQRGTNGGTPT
ncbi:MAG: permease [Sphingomonadales bacterium]|nr:permease [Sphingomonadales bacterium]MBD3773343.1 permease [Paracoccaceae bacterium]